MLSLRCLPRHEEWYTCDQWQTLVHADTNAHTDAVVNERSRSPSAGGSYYSLLLFANEVTCVSTVKRSITTINSNDDLTFMQMVIWEVFLPLTEKRQPVSRFKHTKCNNLPTMLPHI